MGVVGPTTGAVTQYGDMVREGVDTAVERINAAGGWNGQPLELVEFDNQGGPVGASDRFRAAAAEGVQILVQGSSSAISGQLTEDVRKH
ncbi:branched-chain amino acid ABC transporter substrate-binding protein, partial [Escherichia coli]